MVAYSLIAAVLKGALQNSLSLEVALVARKPNLLRLYCPHVRTLIWLACKSLFPVFSGTDLSGPLALALDAKDVRTAGEALKPSPVRTSPGQARAIVGRKNAKDAWNVEEVSMRKERPEPARTYRVPSSFESCRAID